MRLAVRFRCALDRPDKQRCMRPGRLREIFDDTGNPVVAFDQENVTGLYHAAQLFRIARRERLVARQLLLEIAGNQLSNRIEHRAHEPLPSGLF